MTTELDEAALRQIESAYRNYCNSALSLIATERAVLVEHVIGHLPALVAAARERDALRRDRERLVEALRPFADEMERFARNNEAYEAEFSDAFAGVRVSLGDLRAARTLLAELDAAGEKS